MISHTEDDDRELCDPYMHIIVGVGDGCNFSFHEPTKYGDDKGTTRKKSANNILTSSLMFLIFLKRARGKGEGDKKKQEHEETSYKNMS